MTKCVIYAPLVSLNSIVKIFLWNRIPNNPPSTIGPQTDNPTPELTPLVEPVILHLDDQTSRAIFWWYQNIEINIQITYNFSAINCILTPKTFKYCVMQIPKNNTKCWVLRTHAAVFIDNSIGTSWILIMGLRLPEEAGTARSLLMGMLACLQAVWGERSESDREGGVCTCQVEKCCEATSPASMSPTMLCSTDEIDIEPLAYICTVLHTSSNLPLYSSAYP